MALRRIPNKRNPYYSNVTGGAGVTLTAEASNARTAQIQLRGPQGEDLAVRGAVVAYLSDDANGDTLAAAAPSGGVAAGTDGLVIPLVAGKVFQLVSEADGDIDLVITEATAKTFHLIIVTPDGGLTATPVAFA